MKMIIKLQEVHAILTVDAIWLNKQNTHIINGSCKGDPATYTLGTYKCKMDAIEELNTIAEKIAYSGPSSTFMYYEMSKGDKNL